MIQLKNASVIALCSGLMAASLPFTVNAEEDNTPAVSFYGRIHVSGDYLNDGDDGGLNVASNSSRIGVKMSYQLDNQLTLLGQIERTVDISEGNSSLSARNTFIGLQGNWGTLKAGYHDSPVKRILNAVEQFREQVGEGRNIVRSGEMNLDRRLKSGIHYTSPTKYNLTWMAHYGTSEQPGANTDTENDAFSTSLAYRLNEWQAIIGFEQQSREGQEAIEGMRMALIRKQGAWTNAFFYQHASGMATGTQEAFGITGAYALNTEYSLRGQVFHRTAKEFTELDATMVTLGVNRKVNAAVDLYATVSHTDNADFSMANVSAGGHGKTLVILPGNDPFALSVGVRWSF